MSNEELVLKYQSTHDLEERKELLTKLHEQNIGMIASIANRYDAYCEIDDLMQEGYLGMVTAIEHWNALKGATFASYAYYWILQNISKYAKNNGSALRIPEYQQSLMKKYERIVSDYYIKTAKTPPDRYLMLYLRINKQQLEQLKKDIEAMKLKSMDSPIISEGMNITIGESIADDTDQYQAVEDKIQNEQLANVLWDMVDNSLDSIQSTIIKEKYQNNRSTEDMADMLGISKGKVHNQTEKAMRVLRNYKNRKKLRPFLSDESIYSISLGCSGYGSFVNTWISAPERVILIEDARGQRLEK